MPCPLFSSSILFPILATLEIQNWGEKLSPLSLLQSFELTLSNRLRIWSVDLVSLKSITSLSSPSPSLVLIHERLGKPLCVHLRSHLVALGGDCHCGFLITLGDCRHLDGWWFVDWWGDLVIVSAPNQSACEGLLCLPRQDVKGNFSKLLVSLSYPHLWVGYCGTQLLG